MSFWQSNFWAAGFWRANFWHGPDAAPPGFVGGGSGGVNVFTRRRGSTLVSVPTVIPPVPRMPEFPRMPWEKRRAHRRAKQELPQSRPLPAAPAKDRNGTGGGKPAAGKAPRRTLRKRGPVVGIETAPITATDRFAFARIVDEFLALGYDLPEAEEMAARLMMTGVR